MIADRYTANESLQLLWVHFKEPSVDLKLTDEELSYLKLTVIDEWETLTTVYKKQLVTTNKLEFISLCSRNQELFI